MCITHSTLCKQQTQTSLMQKIVQLCLVYDVTLNLFLKNACSFNVNVNNTRHFNLLTLLWTPIGALTSSVVMGTPSSSNNFWKVRTGAKTPASHTVPAQSKIHAWPE